ncbi:alpha/beta fold hydrolase [Actinoallomurus sp. CA-142502]|uniref:alpha/beta fold hydrolase n=1 Tax=Actinoallomurus sp. CA-142502 TaxID=3239885 RepID=UPI003D94F2C5
MTEHSIRRAGTLIAAVLAVDGLAHMYWSTGLTWPAADSRTLSFAVLGFPVPFTPQILLPLAAALFGAALLVHGRVTLGRRHRLGWLPQAGTVAVAAGLLIRALAGLVWACGIGVRTGTAFYWLNLCAYTPACLGLGLAAVTVVRYDAKGRSWLPCTVLPLLVTAVALYGAYGYTPVQQRGYRPEAGSRFVDTPVARFHYLREGQGPAIVLLSPGAASTFAWRPQLTTLARTHTVYAVDLPGQGFTELHDHGFRFDLPSMVSAVDTFLDAVSVRSAVLGGDSWSGGWALAYAQRHPQRVSRLILLAPSGLARPDVWSWELLKPLVVGELATKAGFGSRAAVAAGVRDLFVHRERVTGPVIDAMWAPGTLRDNLRSEYLLERGLDWRTTQNGLRRTLQPTLIVWGAKDTVLPVAQAATFGRLLPNARVSVLGDCGHALTLDCPDQVTGLMEDFLGVR